MPRRVILFQIKKGPLLIDILLCLYDFDKKRQVKFDVERRWGSPRPMFSEYGEVKCRVKSVTIGPEGTFLLEGWAEIGTYEERISARYCPQSQTGEMEVKTSKRIL
jgi:hypothetical protein